MSRAAPGPEPTSALDCTVLHVDMDAFFAAVEVLDAPELAGKPVIVGGSGSRGVVASCTYEARAYGVRSAMPAVEARRRCPHATFIAGRYWRYQQVSEQLHQIFHEFTPLVEPIGLDEAFLDVAGARRLLGAPPAIAAMVRATVSERLQLTCSVGVARTKLLAKLASEAAKPLSSPEGPRPGRGVVVVDPRGELSFLHALPVRALWGVGPATAARLERLGVTTVAELAALPEETLRRSVGDAHGRHLAALARGEDSRTVEPDRAVKSVGHEETFVSDLHTHQALHGHLVRMADAVASRLLEAGRQGRTVTVKIRFGDFTTITRSHTLPEPTTSAHDIRAVAAGLLQAVDVGPGVRLLGLSVSGLHAGSDARQLSFAELADPEAPAASEPNRPGEWDQVESAMAAVRARYGDAAVAPATMAGDRGISVKRRGDAQWGPCAPSGPTPDRSGGQP